MSKYTPELADLMEHEKAIEQAITSAWHDVAWALEQIRDGKKYRASGYTSFDSYCRERWNFTRRRADQLIAAGKLRTTVLVSNEREARKMLAPQRDHPATFSDVILTTIAEHVGPVTLVVDPFAGTGRVHELRERAGVTRTLGVELEPEWASKHPDTITGDALKLGRLMRGQVVDAIATSPTYGNRMADHHNANDESTRLTYKHTLGRDLTDGNSGALQWGDEYRAFHLKAWREAVNVLRPGGTFTLNIKNHVRDGEVQRVAEWHINTLMHALGLSLERLDIVATRGLMAGENSDQRTAHEYVVTMRKVAP